MTDTDYLQYLLEERNETLEDLNSLLIELKKYKPSQRILASDCFLIYKSINLLKDHYMQLSKGEEESYLNGVERAKREIERLIQEK